MIYGDDECQMLYDETQRQRSIITKQNRLIKKLNKYGHILAMRVLQSELLLDDEEMTARDSFLPKT